MTDIRDKIQKRIDTLRQSIKQNMDTIAFNEREGGLLDGENNATWDEIEFLKEILNDLNSPVQDPSSLQSR